MKNVSNKIDLLWYRINIQLSEKYCVGWERLISWILTLGENGWGMDLWRNNGLE